MKDSSNTDGSTTPLNKKTTKLSVVSTPASHQGLSGQVAKPNSKAPEIVSFNRQELGILLNVYGRKVASGEWRDYAMDMLRDRAVFSIYRRASERPQFIIEKNPKLRNKQGQYVVSNFEGRILKRGHDLKTVTKVLEPRLIVVK